MSVFVPDDLLEQDPIRLVVVSRVVVPPKLRSWQREVPKLVNHVPYSLLLNLQPEIITIAGLVTQDVCVCVCEDTELQHLRACILMIIKTISLLY